MDSLDDSFTWMSASSGSQDSDEESNKHKMTENHIESESEKSYKKKLHKKLFKSESEVKQELLNGDSMKPEPDSDAGATPRKRKRKHDRTPSIDSTGHEYLEARVKQEHHSEEKPKKRKKRHTENESQDLSQNSELGLDESLVKPENYEEKPKKRKKKHTENENQDLSQDSELDAKESLDALVKQESHNDEKPKKHKKKHKEDANESLGLSQESEFETNKSQDDSQNSEIDATDHRKKKKSKRQKERHESEMIIEDKFEAEETVVETRPRQHSTNMDVDEHEEPGDEIVKKEKKKKKKRHISEKEYQDDSSAVENTLASRNSFTENHTDDNHDEDDKVLDSPSKSKQGKKKNKKISDRIQFESRSSIEKDASEDDIVENHDTDEVINTPSKSKKAKEKSTKISDRKQFETRNSFIEKDTSDDDAAENRNTNVVLESPSKSRNTDKRATKISERLQFEDEDDVIAAANEATENFSQQSSKMRRFLKANPHLQSIQCASTRDSIISKDDEIWLLHCPHEVEVSSLKDTNISLDNKCKIKIDSQTFIGHVENEKNRAAIFTFEHNRPVIKSVELQGVINFRKRIPKPHLFEDNIIANNQTNFIPLPDTKCRHPFFGPDYKKAIKIPSTIKSRLINSDSETSSTPKAEKKKKKKKHVENDETDMGVDVPDGVVDKQPTGRKRHHSEIVDADQPIKNKAKKIKKEKQSGESWDSEKAIEDNLFNF